MSKNPTAQSNNNGGWTRRNFLITTIGGFGGLCVGFQMIKNGLLGEANAASEYQINAYVRIGTDNRITILFGGCEFGQGSMTGLAQIVAGRAQERRGIKSAYSRPTRPSIPSAVEACRIRSA